MITSFIWPHPLPYGDPKHGTLNGYGNLGCRCPDCRAASAQAQRQARKVRAARLVADPSLATHGKANTYVNWACHCRPCTKAKSAVDTIGRRRRATP